MGENRSSGFITGLVVGAAIGAGLALLFGTKKGKEVREQIRSQYPEFFDQVEAILGDEKNSPQPKRFIKSGRKL